MRMVILTFIGILGLAVAGAIGLWFYWFKSDVALTNLETRYANAQSHFVDIAGMRVHYRDEGRRDGPLLVLIHGFGDNFGTWDGWIKPLASRYRLIRLDLPGHGLTQSAPDTQIDAGAFADVVAKTATLAGGKRFVVVGNSLGGAVAWQTAVRHPRLVSALVLVDAAGWQHPAPKNIPFVFRLLQYRWAREILATIDNTPLIVASLRGEVRNPAVITDALVTRWAALQLAPYHRRILLLNPAGAVAGATTRQLSAVKVPTLILWGKRDPVLPSADADLFAQAICGARVIRYDDVGHLPQIEIPERSAEDVAAFLQASLASGRRRCSP